ncbi:MAG: hypothetical protein A3F90_09760 [Deltaproteobacteria bacterium RIFCSPLOWO2_12_FULL_60_19]|nr:MAG: hypothetical protein A3F90_09760 [Deltaproteobacteria bacterium RIFCSPLOWO2_12_FULL_60_19]
MSTQTVFTLAGSRLEDFFQRFGARRLDEDARAAAVRAAMADVDFQNLKPPAQIHDDVQNLGKNQRVDDMAGEMDQEARHRKTILPLPRREHKALRWDRGLRIEDKRLI